MARELRQLGTDARAVEGGVDFLASWEGVWAANLWSRVASRVLVRIAEFEATTFSALERGLGSVTWDEWLPRGASLDIRVAKHATPLYHTGKVAGIVGRVVGEGVCAAASAAGEPFRLQIRIAGRRVTVSLDTSGEHLHRRGYRVEPGAAPLRENLAAALLLRGGWQAGEPLLDPLCGSGTLAIEAALLARKVPPGWFRTFAFEGLPSFERPRWEAIRAEAARGILESLPAPIYASDQDPEAVAAAARAARRAGLADHLSVGVAPVEELDPPEPSGFLLTNPPYGVRLGGEPEAYRALGRALRGPFRRWHWGIVVPRRETERALGLAAVEDRFPFRNGGLRIWFLCGGPEAP